MLHSNHRVSCGLKLTNNYLSGCIEKFAIEKFFINTLNTVRISHKGGIIGCLLLFFSYRLSTSMTSQLPTISVPGNSIDITDNTYRLRPEDDALPDQHLDESIQRMGILQPPLLQPGQNNNETRYIILSGYKRILAAQSHGIGDIVCLILPLSTEPALKWHIILTHALIGSRLSCIEQATFFSKAAKELSISEQLLLLPLLGRKPQPYVLQELAGYLTLAPETTKALHAGYLHEKRAKQLAKLSHQDQRIVIELIRYYKLGGTKQKKLVNMAFELVMRTGDSFQKILEKWNQDQFAAENRPQQAMALLSWLERQCFPKSTIASEQFKQFQRTLQLPKNYTLTPSPSFEDDSLTLSIFFTNQNQFLQHWPSLKDIMARDHE